MYGVANRPLDKHALAGALLGTAIGDARGLPYEGLPPGRLVGVDLARWPLGRGYVSDDTEQTALVVEALCTARDLAEADARVTAMRSRSIGWIAKVSPPLTGFAATLTSASAPAGARIDAAAIVDAFRPRLRRWFLRVPFGVGFATTRACLWLLVGARSSGVASAGNGAAMRSGALGVALWDRPDLRRDAAIAVAKVTHTDPRAVEGAVYVAEVAAACANAPVDADRRVIVWTAAEPLAAVRDALVAVLDLDRAEPGIGPADVAAKVGNTGFIDHTLAIATWAFLRAGDSPVSCADLAIRAGGDTDSTAAIAAGWAGALVGDGPWTDVVEGIDDGPFGPRHLRGLATAWESGREAPGWSGLRARVRNLVVFGRLIAWVVVRRFAKVG